MPSQGDFFYTDKHVHIHKNMLERNITIPFKYVCITDEPVEGIECVPLWDICTDLGGCYNRLYVYSKDMKDILGERFMYTDLDVVITSNIDHIVGRTEDFVINSYKPLQTDVKYAQKYNGGMILMDAGARSHVWDDFDPYLSPHFIEKKTLERQCIGSDQAWASLMLDNEALFTEEDGVYEMRQAGRELPENACMVFFAGRRDPSECNYEWVKKHWC